MEEKKTETKTTNRLHLIGDVDAESVNKLIASIRELHDDDQEGEITLYISSSGGGVRAGLAFYEYVKLTGVNLTTIGIGEVGSIAVIIWLAGKRRMVSKRSYFLIHEGSVNYEHVEYTCRRMTEEAANGMFLSDLCDGIIAEAIDKSREHVQKACSERYMTIAKAIEFGLLKKENVIEY